MRFWKKGLALLLSILMVLSMCGFAESQPDATPAPDPTATPAPVATPAPDPTATPAPDPTATPDPDPTATPDPDPTVETTEDPTPVPTAEPTVDPNAPPEPCKHEDIDQWETNSCFVGVSNITEDTHTATYQRIYEGYCLDCRMDLDPWMETETVVEDHWFPSGNGICGECGYNKGADCTHETIIWRDEAEINTSFEFIDATSHRITDQEILYGECANCHKQYTKTVGDPVVTVEAHEFDGSVCFCGFYANMANVQTCAHAHVHEVFVKFDNWDMSDAVFVEEEGLCVQIAGYALVNTYCDDCGMVIASTYKFVNGQHYVHESHDFPQGGDTCTRCGYQNLCKHENAVVGKDHADWQYEKDNGDGTHSYISTVFCYKLCLDCNARFSETIEYEPVTESHSYDEHNECYICGAVNTNVNACDHLSVATSTFVNYEWYGGSNPVYVDENYHEMEMLVNTYSYDYCTYCGQRLGFSELVSQEKKTVQLPHSVSMYDHGYCWECDHMVKTEYCAHDPEYIYYEPWINFNSLVEGGVRDESGHECIYELYLNPICGKCGYLLDDEGTDHQKLSGVLPHEYDIYGRCIDCGYTLPCKHENIHFYEDSYVEQCTMVDEKTHKSLVKVCNIVVCKDCGYISSNFDHYTTETGEHVIVDGWCVECSFVPDCRHPNLKADSTLSWNDTWFKYQNAASHFKVTSSEEIGICPDCGLEVVISHREVRLPYQPHVYDADGWCDCGAEKVCTHPDAYDVEQRDFRETRYVPLKGSDTQHAVVIYTRYRSYCPDCDQYVGDPTEPEPVRTLMSRTFAHTFVDGVCKVCDFGCVHPEAQRTYGQPVVTASTDAVDDAFHTTTTITTTGFTCALCTMDGTRIDAAAGDNVKHSYKDDGKGNYVCADCGHTCGHANATATDVPVFDHYEISASGHAPVSTVTTTGVCPDCGNSSVEVKTVPGPVEAHTFSDLKCTLCGYTKSAPTATPAPAEEMPVVQDEQILTEVPADEVVHGVAAAENLRMGVAMVRVMRNITEEYGKNTEVRIVNADKVLAGAEYKALESLSPDEGILVVLSLLGHLNEVNVATDDLDFKLSEDAQILIDAITARIADMDETARAEFTALLAEAFPVFTTDGDVEQTEISIEIKLREDNSYRLERYTFRCEDGVWYLASLAN